jgi:hypothetical protein
MTLSLPSRLHQRRHAGHPIVAWTPAQSSQARVWTRFVGPLSPTQTPIVKLSPSGQLRLKLYRGVCLAGLRPNLAAARRFAIQVGEPPMSGRAGGIENEQNKIVYEYVDGQTRNRKAHVDRFQQDSDCPVFLISLKAGPTNLPCLVRHPSFWSGEFGSLPLVFLELRSPLQ